ncbi:MAG: 4Fe-4S binding protein [Deltaproteobacteria bacterium]|nr:4Fe-4S binding protein [Deltaproteobacteria bacterium]
MSHHPGRMVGELLRHSVRQPATIRYPAVKADLPDKFRGRIQFIAERCIGCRMCMRDCPSNAIHITKEGDKRFSCRIYLDRCIYCAQCVDTCPKDALYATMDFELAAFTHDALQRDYDAPPATAEPEAPPAPETKDSEGTGPGA